MASSESASAVVALPFPEQAGSASVSNSVCLSNSAPKKRCMVHLILDI